jgi:hypothetical protein
MLLLGFGVRQARERVECPPRRVILTMFGATPTTVTHASGARPVQRRKAFPQRILPGHCVRETLLTPAAGLLQIRRTVELAAGEDTRSECPKIGRTDHEGGSGWAARLSTGWRARELVWKTSAAKGWKLTLPEGATPRRHSMGFQAVVETDLRVSAVISAVRHQKRSENVGRFTPASVAETFQRLRIITPAPASSTTASAISGHQNSRQTPSPPPRVPRPPSFNEAFISTRQPDGRNEAEQILFQPIPRRGHEDAVVHRVEDSPWRQRSGPAREA